MLAFGDMVGFGTEAFDVLHVMLPRYPSMQASLVQVSGVGVALASHFSWRDIHPTDCLSLVFLCISPLWQRFRWPATERIVARAGGTMSLERLP